MKFNDIDLNSYFNILSVTRRLPPLTNYFKKIPGFRGTRFIKSEIESAYLDVRVELKGDAKAELYEAIRALAPLLYTDEPKKLELPNETDKYYMAKLDGASDIKEILYFGELTLTFYLPDPASFGYTVTENLVNGSTYNNQSDLPVGGTITVAVSEAVNYLEIALLNTAEYLYLDHELVSGDVVVVDLENEHIAKNGLSVMDDLYLGSDFFTIPRGIFEIFISSGSAVLEYSQRWWF